MLALPHLFQPWFAVGFRGLVAAYLGLQQASKATSPWHLHHGKASSMAATKTVVLETLTSSYKLQTSPSPIFCYSPPLHDSYLLRPYGS